MVKLVYTYIHTYIEVDIPVNCTSMNQSHCGACDGEACLGEGFPVGLKLDGVLGAVGKASGHSDLLACLCVCVFVCMYVAW